LKGMSLLKLLPVAMTSFMVVISGKFGNKIVLRTGLLTSLPAASVLGETCETAAS
jgi:hypothetical protein